MSDALTITVKADTRDGVRAVNELREALAETQEQARNVFAKGLSESLPEQLQDVSRGMRIAADGSQGLTTRLQAGVGATLIAKNAMMELGARLIDVARAFGENAAAIEQEQRALRALGTTYDSVRASTSGTTTATEALSMRQTLLRAGLSANHDVMARVARLGREYAQTYGGTATEAVNTFVSAIQSGDAAALQPFGVRLTTAKNATDRLSQAVEQLGDRFSRVEAAGRTAAESQQAFERGLTRLRQNALEGVNSALLGLPGLLHQGITALGDLVQTERGAEDATDRASRALERQGEAARTTATATAALTSELSKADEQLKAFEETLQQAPAYTRGANETFQDTVSRASQQALNAIGRARQQREIQRAVARSLGRLSAADRAAAGLEALPTADDPTRVAMEVSGNNLQLNQVVGQLAALGIFPDGQLTGNARNRRSNNLRFQLAMTLLQRQLQREQAARAAMQGASLDNSFDVEGYREGGSDRGSFDTELAALSERGLYSSEITRQRDAMRRAAEARAYDDQKALEAREQARRQSFGGQVGSRLGLSDSLDENLASPIRSAADSVKSSFDSMTQGLNGFLDTLIESPDQVGAASVNIAKQFLKGLAMMSLQESLYNLAKGIAASFTPGQQPAAAGYFTASAIFAGVAAASGAGAAGIAAAQRGAQPAPAGSTGASSMGPASVGGTGSREERGAVVFNINSTVFDPERAEETVARLMRGAQQRGVG